MKGLLEANEQSQAGPGRPESTKQDQKLQVGIDSFASQFVDHGAEDEASASNGIRHLVERIELADQVSLDVFGVGEHHRKEFLDSAPALTGQGVYPRPMQNPLPIWLGVGGTPESFARAGTLGLPLMVAIIGGETRRFRPLVDVYREYGRRAGHAPDQLKVGVHALGYVAETT